MTKFTKFAVAAAFAFIALAGVKASAYVTVPPNLMQGSMGAQVMNLQSALGITADGNFGSGTKAAVMSFQASHGLGSDGVVGPMTASALNAMGTTTGTYPAGCSSNSGYSMTTGMSCAASMTTYPAGCTSNSGFSMTTGMSCAASTTFPAGCSSAEGFSPTTGDSCSGSSSGGSSGSSSDFNGTEGSVKSYDVGSPSESDLTEGQEEQEVLSVDVELEQDGDLQLDRADFYFELSDNTVTALAVSTKPWDYVDHAYLMVDGDTVADMDVSSSSDWTDYSAAAPGHVADTAVGSDYTNKEYRIRFDGFSAMLPSDETTSVSVAFDAVSSIDSNDELADWNWALESDSFRFTDGTDFVFTDGDTSIDDSFSIAGEDVGDLKITEDTSNPDAMVIQVDDSSDTNGVEIAAFNIEEKQGVDVNIDEMTVGLSTTALTAYTGTVLNKVSLFADDELIGTESVTGSTLSETITFNNLDFDISGDDTVKFTLEVDIDDTDNQVRYVNGSTVQVTSVAITDATDEFDNDATTSGSFVGDVMTLYATGIAVDFISATTSATTGTGTPDDLGTFTIKFKISAFGDTIYVPNAAVLSPSTVAVNFTVDKSGVAAAGATGALVDDTDSALSAGTNFAISEGSSENFTMTVSQSDVVPGAGLFRAVLSNVLWNTTDSAVTFNSYTTNLDDFHTDYLSLN